MVNLYEITAELQSVFDQIDASEGEVSDDLSARLDAIEGALDKKIINIVRACDNMEAEAAGLKAAEERMAKRRKSLEKRIDDLHDYAAQALQRVDKNTVVSAEHRIGLRKTPMRVEIFDLALVPAEYMRTPEPPAPQPDKVAIGKALKADIPVAGCKGVTGWRLDIK